MKKKDIHTLINFTIEEVCNIYDEHELEILLYVEPDIIEVDMMLEKMEVYLIELEEFEKCCIVRDEKLRRKSRIINRKNYIR